MFLLVHWQNKTPNFSTEPELLISKRIWYFSHLSLYPFFKSLSMFCFLPSFAVLFTLCLPNVVYQQWIRGRWLIVSFGPTTSL